METVKHPPSMFNPAIPMKNAGAVSMINAKTVKHPTN
jgi:hypothetical protein